jgi:excisionase family DNA binding protein
MTRPYIGLTEAAIYLAISPRTMRRLISDGEITATGSAAAG